MGFFYIYMIGMAITAMLVAFGKASGLMEFVSDDGEDFDPIDYVFWVIAWPRTLAMILAAIGRRF